MFDRGNPKTSLTCTFLNVSESNSLAKTKVYLPLENLSSILIERRKKMREKKKRKRRRI